MSSIKRFISQIFMSCPYTMAGKKCVNAVTGKKEERKVSSCKAEEYKAGIKLSRNITLIGFFCPIFWGSVIMGAPASVILFNLTHSGIIIALGALIALLNYVKYRRA